MKMLAESLFLEHVPDQAKQKEFLGTIVRECERLRQLIERVLFLVRFGQDALVFRPQAVDPGELAASAVETFNARQTGQDVVLEVANDLPRIKADRSAITQVILNLLDNAAKYGKRGGHVELTVEKNQEIHIRVIDDGPGIAANHLPHLFTRFYRTEKGRSRSEGGTGLGLAIVKHIAQAHGGMVKVESRLRKGSTFLIRLPNA